MTLKTFIGGINPRDSKEATKDSPIEIILPGKELVYPLAGKVGTPAKAIVKVGDKVLAGQKIGRADGFFSVPIHASVSGTVKGIRQRTIFTGERVRSIVIENDELYDEIEPPALKPYEEMSSDEMIARIQDAGIVGMSGSGYPTHIKLSPKYPDKISHIIVNGAECEPYLTSDHRLMLEETNRLIAGLKVLLKLFPYAWGVFAITDNKPGCISRLKEMTQKEPRISVKTLKTKYPQGAERQMVMAITGRLLDSSILPSDVGVILLSIDTVIQIARAIVNGKNLISRIVTVAGDAIVKPRNFSARLGTSYETLITAAGGFTKEPAKILSGGPMMGHALTDINVPLTKVSTAILGFEKDETAGSNATACINCNKCAAVCPEHLLPKKLAVFSKYEDEESFLGFDGIECTKCGCCSYICPAKLNLTEAIVLMKGNVERKSLSTFEI